VNSLGKEERVGSADAILKHGDSLGGDDSEKSGQDEKEKECNQDEPPRGRKVHARFFCRRLSPDERLA
jgi:hypothetical protein